MDPWSVNRCWMNGRVDGCSGSGRPSEAMVMGARCVVRFVLPVRSPWRSGPSCTLDVGREPSKLHSHNGAEANSMLSCRRYTFLSVNQWTILFFSFIYVWISDYNKFRNDHAFDTLSVLSLLQHWAPISALTVLSIILYGTVLENRTQMTEKITKSNG